MDKMMVVVFESETKAYEGLRALKQLDTEQSITLYASAVVAKTDKDDFGVRQAADQGPLGTAVGLMTGSLLGLWGGPVGFAVAASTGMIGGILYDLSRSGVTAEFLDDVGRQLEPGMIAIVAEVGEDWVTPVDTRMEALGGVVFRRARTEVVDGQIESEIKAAREDVAALKAEAARASAARKAKIEAKLAQAKARLQSAQERAKASIDEVVREGEAKVALLEQRTQKAAADSKAALTARIDRTRTEAQARKDRLQRAWAAAKKELEA